MPRKRGRNKKEQKPEYSEVTIQHKSLGLPPRVEISDEVSPMTREQRVEYEIKRREEKKRMEVEAHQAMIDSTKLNEAEKQFAKLEAISYGRYTNFIKSHEDVVVVVYEVPTSRLITTDQIESWRLGLTTALLKAAEVRRLQIAHRDMHFEATSKTAGITLIKGYFRIRDASGAGADQHRRQAPPAGKEGMIIE